MIIHLGETEWHDIKRKFNFAPLKGCPHVRLQYIEHGELLLCLDCEKQVTAVWALHLFFSQYLQEKEAVEQESARLKVERDTQVVHRAALKFQEMVRKRKFFPACPHCFKAIELDGQIFGGGKNKEHYKSEALPLVMKPNLSIVEREEEDGH